jgi:hypothetical protein
MLDEGRQVLPKMGELEHSRRRRPRELADRFFAKIVDVYLAATGNQGGRVGNALSYVVGARGLLDFTSHNGVCRDRSPRGPDDSSKTRGLYWLLHCRQTGS